MSPTVNPTPQLVVVSLSTACWGAEQSLLLLAANVRADVLVACPRGELFDRAGAAGLGTLALDDPAVLRCAQVGSTVGTTATGPVLLAGAAALARLPLWDRDAAVSFSQWLHLPLALAGRVRRRRVVLDLHDGPFSRGGSAVQSAATWTATATVAVSRTALEHVRSWPSGRATVVPRPVGLPELKDRAPHDDDGRPLRLAIVGRLDPEKRVDVALTAHEMLLAAGVPAVLDVVGDGHRSAADLAALRRRWPGAVFHGRLPHAQALGVVADADLLLSTAVGEAFGRTVLEAALLGVPSVVVGGGPAERVRDGVDGFVVPPDDPASLAALLTRLAADRDQVSLAGAAALETAGRVASPSGVAARWLQAVLP